MGWRKQRINGNERKRKGRIQSNSWKGKELSIEKVGKRDQEKEKD